MQENLTSSVALHEEQSTSEAIKQTDIAADEKHEKKAASFGDTVTLQAILCIIMALGFIAVNIANGNLASDVFDLYKSKFSSESTVIEVFASIADFLGTAPINNV